MKSIDTETMNSHDQVAEILLTINAITLSPKHPFRFASGIVSPIYTDCRLLISYPKERTIIRDFYLKAMQSYGTYEVIAGTATAGIPHAAWIADSLQLPLAYIRGKSKDHGKKNQIEGIIEKNQKVAVIEDLISTGESAIESVQAIRNHHGIASTVFAITTYGFLKAEKSFKENKISLITLTNFSTIFKKAIELKKITGDQEKILTEWINDPPNWGKKFGFE